MRGEGDDTHLREEYLERHFVYVRIVEEQLIYYYDADGNGVDSIADVLQAKPKEITHIPIRTYEEFDAHVSTIVHKVTSDDLVIVDTLNSLANTTRGDAKLGTDPTENLWARREKILGDKNYLTVYELAGQLILRRLKNLGKCGQGARIIVTCHEAEKLDDTTVPPTKKRGPDVNPALLGALMGSSSDVFRLRSLDDPITNDKGEIILPVDTRLLELRRSDEIMAKYHVPLSRVPSIKRALPNPTLPMLYKHLGKKPTWLTIYGPPGVGKSTFVTSELR